MPTYDFQCQACGHLEADKIRSLAEYNDPCPCPQCEYPMTQLISAPAIVMDYAGYQCPITDKWIEGKRAHRENLAKHGCRVLEPGERENVLRQKAAEEKALDDKLDQTIGKAIEAMPPRQQEKLHSELMSGANLTVARQ